MKDPSAAYRDAVNCALDASGTLDTVGFAAAIRFGLNLQSPADLAALSALMTRVGLVSAHVCLDGSWFEFDSPRQPNGGWPAWILPVSEFPVWGSDDDGIVDLVAFVIGGKHDGRVCRYTGVCDEIGFRMPGSAGEVETFELDIFTQPLFWLKYWIARCLDCNPAWLLAEDAGPDAFGALVLDPRKMNWGALLGAKDLRFRDSPDLRSAVAKEHELERSRRLRAVPKLGRLRAVKLSSNSENEHGPPRTAA